MNRKDCQKYLDHLGALRAGKASIEKEAKEIQNELLPYMTEGGLLVVEAKLYKGQVITNHNTKWFPEAIEVLAARCNVKMNSVREVTPYRYIRTDMLKMKA